MKTPENNFEEIDKIIAELTSKVEVTYKKVQIFKNTYTLKIILGIGGLTLADNSATKYDESFKTLVISMFTSKPNYQDENPYCIKNGISHYCILDPKTINDLDKSDLARFYLLIGLLKIAEICPKNKIETIGSDSTNAKTARILSIFYGFESISTNYVKISIIKLQAQIPKYKEKLRNLLTKYPEFASLDINSFLVD